MRRLTLAGALAVVLVFAANAFAASLTFEGRGSDDHKVTFAFDLVGPVKHGVIRFEDAEIRDFEISNVTQTLTCQGQEQELTVGWHFTKPMGVDDDGDFEAEEKVAPGQTAKVKGTLKGRAVKGWFRISGKAGGCTVETRRVDWNGFS
jgi:hypothetical protein